MNDRVDIALATFNGEEHLSMLLESIKTQTWSHWNILARDDGSTDQTLKILRQFQAEQPDRIRLIEDKNGTLGPAANFNRLLENCTADYVMLADQDDIWLPQKIEVTLKKMQELAAHSGREPLPLLIHTDLCLIGTVHADSFWKYQHLSPDYGLKFKNLLTQNVVTGCTVMINRVLLDLALPIPREAIMHDWWLALVAATFGRIGFIRTPTVQYRQHRSNNTGAKHWNVSGAIRTILVGRKNLHTGILKTWSQAEAFHARYATVQSIREKRILSRYLQLKHTGFYRRRIQAVRCGFCKNGFTRTLGFYWAL